MRIYNTLVKKLFIIIYPAAYSLIYKYWELISISSKTIKRDITIDIVRGISIFTMVAANMVPKLLKGTPPYILRLYGSFAAPTFIFLSGMMVSYKMVKSKNSCLYFCKRTAILLVTAALIDIFVTGIYPFMTFDVLYLIGISMILTFLFKKLNIGFQLMLVTAVFVLTPLLQNAMGYGRVPVDIPIHTNLKDVSVSLSTIIKQWLIDGWFPLFPWVGFAFIGSIAADIRLIYKNFSNKIFQITAFILLAAGGILWSIDPGEMYVRNGYCELFYPPTPGFILISTGIILSLLCLIDLSNYLKIFKPFSILGKWSLQIYVIHMLIISLLGNITGPQSINIFLLIYAGIVIFLFAFFNILNNI